MQTERKLSCLACVVLVTACGSTRAGTRQGADASAPSDGATYDDGLSDAGEGEGESAAPLEAGPPTPVPTVQYLGGPILSSPSIVTVTFQGDDASLVGRFQQFDDTITSTAWWKAVSSEYCVQPAGSPCVGPGTGGGHVVLPTAASGYTDSIKGGDSTIRALITASVAAGSLPAPDAQTLYVLYLPAGTTVLLDGYASCAPSSFASYHDIVGVTPPDAGPGATTNVAYAVVPRCSSAEAAMTVAASHEIVEAATDPSPENDPAFQLTDMVWTAFGPEVADVCAAVDVSLVTTDSSFSVQRSWSNASATAGHDPCVPIDPGEVYFNVAPEQGTETVALAVGQSATVILYPFADGPASTSWQLSAVASSGSPLGFSVQPATVTAGTRAILTVTLQSSPALGVDQLYGLISQSPTDTHVWPMIVQAK
jgi:hypothetical protein